ncbi:transposase [Candidatus Omnitrophota bacterium]
MLNYFKYWVTNDYFVDGKNNRINTIERMACGYRNMVTFRLRILANNYKDVRSHIHKYQRRTLWYTFLPKRILCTSLLSQSGGSLIVYLKSLGDYDDSIGLPGIF